MRRDKKAAQKKKARAKKPNASQGPNALLRQARTAEFGPAFLSPEWKDDELPPQLVTAIITRKLPGGRFVVQTMLVDRTCLGVKNAFVLPMSQAELDDLVEQMGARHDDVLEEVEVRVAQSVVLHALTYAEELGFDPHADFERSLIEPLPAVLEDTPLARPEQPFFVPGPEDDFDAVLDTLEEAVGENYELGGDFGFDDDDDDDDDRAPDEEALYEAQTAWVEEARKQPDALDLATSMGQFTHAIAGKPTRTLDEADMTSLPFFWASIFSPIGRETGLDFALRTPSMSEHKEELERLGRSRATLFDAVGIDESRNIAECRDVFDGTRLEVRFDDDMLEGLTPGTRLFGYLTPMDDGTWYPPTLIIGHAALAKLAPEEAIRRINKLLADLKIAERIDPAKPLVGLTRFGGLAHGEILRALARLTVRIV